MPAGLIDARASVAPRSFASGAIVHGLGFRVGAASALFLLVAAGLVTAGAVYGTSRLVLTGLEARSRVEAESIAGLLGRAGMPSAENIARALDLAGGDLLAVEAAAAAVLVDAAELSELSSDWIVDALRQATFRSPFSRIDVVSGGQHALAYSTDEAVVSWDAVAPSLRALADGPAYGVARLAPRITPEGWFLQVAARLAGRAAILVVDYRLDPVGAAAVYGGPDDRSGTDAAETHAAGAALFVVHAAELASARPAVLARFSEGLVAFVAGTEAAGVTIYDASLTAFLGAGGTSAPGRDSSRDERAFVDRLFAAGQGSLPGAPWFDPELGHRVVPAAAVRASAGVAAIVAVPAAPGAASFVSTLRQAELDRFSAVDGVTGAWIARRVSSGWVVDASAPRAGLGMGGESPARDRWTPVHAALAANASAAGAAVSAATFPLARLSTSAVMSAVSFGDRAVNSFVPAVVVVERDAAVEALGLVRLVFLIVAGAVVVVASAGLGAALWARRYLTDPVEALAEAADHIAVGVMPPSELTARFVGRRDELGRLVKYFRHMAHDVLRRQEELDGLVRERTLHLEEARDEAAEGRARLDSDLRMAAEVQRTLVPPPVGVAGIFRYACRVTPARELSGDFINVLPLDDGRVFLSLCDVSGKGPAAALFMALSQAVFAEEARSSADLGVIAREANRRLSASNPLGMFVTAILILLEPREGRLAYLCVGHECPVLLRAGRLVELDKPDILPFGIADTESYPPSVLVVKPGDLVCSWTDGVTDAVDTGGSLFGEDRLMDVLRSARDEAPETVINEVWREIDAFSSGAETVDDQTMLLVSAAAPAATAVAGTALDPIVGGGVSGPVASLG